MKKLILALAASLVGVSMALSSSALASDCTITNTGPNSVNTCVHSEVTTVTVTCTNGVNVVNLNSQFSSSGQAVVSGNTLSANATSGSASNASSLAVDLALNCAPAQTTTTTTTTSPPVTPTPVQPVTPTVVSLPKTGNDTLLVNLGIAVAALGLAGVASQLAVSAYHRHITRNI